MMKKLIAMLVALTMVLSLSAVFAASVDADDVVGPVTPATNVNTGAQDDGESLPLLLKVDTTEDAAALTEKLLAAQNDAEKTPADEFPAELAVEKEATVQEVISVVLNPAYPVEPGKAYSDPLTITADVSKAAKVRVLVGIVPADADEMAWYEGQDVKVEEDGVTLTVTYGADVIAAMDGAKSVTLVVLSVPAE